MTSHFVTTKQALVYVSESCFCAPIIRVGYREPVPIWNQFQYNRYLPGPKCNADFGASFRCLSQLKTVARQIPRGTCKTAPAPNVNFVLCRSRSLVFS